MRYNNASGWGSVLMWEIIRAILMLLTGVGVFLVGVVMFTHKLEKPSDRMYRFFAKTGRNRYTGVAMGTGLTMVTQSSTATSVIVIALVNGGVLTLFQATAIIMGANVGTSLTSLLTTLSAFPIRYGFMMLVFAGALIKLFTKRPKWIYAGNLFIGIGLLFVGLHIMSGAFSDNQILMDTFTDLFQAVTFPLLLILIGAVFTIIMQSSTAVIGILVVLVSQGLVDFSSVMFLIIGTNIGTTFTTIIVSLPANRDAKRVACVQVLFKLIGSAVFTIIFWPLQSLFVPWYQNLITQAVWQLSVFHVIFNVGTMFMLLWLIKPLNWLAYKIIPKKPSGEGFDVEAEEQIVDIVQ